MQEFRKTATIRAVQWRQHGDHPAVVLKSDRHRYADEGVPWIETLEGGHIVTPGDWIATGIQGEHWPIKPDIFAATYEPVTSPTTNPVAVSETPVGDHQMVDAVARAIAHVLNKDDIPDGGWPGLMKEAAHAAINQVAEGDVVRRAKQRTIDRLHREAEGLRTKLVDALADRQAPLTAARAQVEGESEYRKVHEQAVIKRGEAWANHHMTSDGLIGERVTNDTASHIIRTTTEVFALAAGEHRKDAP